MAETGREPGKLGLVILENLIESKLGEEVVKEQHIPKNEQNSITEAVRNTADRLWKDWADKRAWEALFDYLPSNKKFMADFKPAVDRFYMHPTDVGLAKLLIEIMQDHNKLPPETIQKAVGDFITTLTEELILADENFLNNARDPSHPKQVAGLHHVEETPVSQPPPASQKASEPVPPRQVDKEETQASALLPLSQKVQDTVTPRQVDDGELKVALARLSKLPLNRIPKPASLPDDSRFPTILPDSPFVGRKEDLKQLAAWLRKGDTVVITQAGGAIGMGGIGKTQLAYAFAQRYGRFFCGGIFWLNFTEPDLIPSEVAACGSFADGFPLETRVQQVLSDWQSGMPRLLIFDNCEDPQLLAQWRPVTGGSRVLVTSRQSNWDTEPGIQNLPIGLLEKPDSIALLRAFREDLEKDDPSLDAIATDLGNMPLALHMAGSFLSTYRLDINPGQFLEALHQARILKKPSVIGDEFTPSGSDMDVGRAFAVDLEWLSQEGETNRLALDLLKQIACFAPGEFIPRELLRTRAGAKKFDLAAFGEGVNRLTETGLIDGNEAGYLRMHWLVCWYVRDSLPDMQVLAQVEQTVLSAAANTNQSGNPAKMQPVLAHLKHLTDQALKGRHEQAARLANELGYYLEAISDFPGARSYYEQALAFNQRTLGEGHPDTTISLNNLGGLLERMGDLAGARPYYEKALVIRRKVLGMEHLDTARSLNNMGHLLQAMGDYAGARPYYAQALTVRRRMLGEENAATITSINNLGVLHQSMGDFTGARPYFEQALAINQKMLGEKHPNTASSLANLGGMLYAMGDSTGARSYYEQALAIRSRVLGQEHPDTATSLNDMGKVLQRMGDHAGAQAYFDQALAIRRKVLGEEHPDTASSLNNLGEVLHEMGDSTRARQFYEQALVIRKKVLGEEHPDTAASLNKLGSLLLALGDQTGAHLYLEEARAIEQNIEAEKRLRAATGSNLRAYSLRAKILLAVLFFLSFGVIGWQAFSRQGVSSTALYGLVPTANETSVLHLSDFFPGLAITPARTTSHRVTATPTWTPTTSATSTRGRPTLTLIPTSTSLPTVYVPVKPPVPTNTSAPTKPPIRPTPVPQETATPAPPTPIRPTPVPQDTPVPGTAVPPTSAPPTSVPPTAGPPTSAPPTASTG